MTMAKTYSTSEKVRLHKKLTEQEKIARQIERQYQSYKKTFQRMKKSGLIKRNTRQQGKRQFENFIRRQLGNEGISVKAAREQLVEAQSKFGSLSNEKIYLAYRQFVKNGYKVDNTYWGISGTGKGGTDGAVMEVKSYEDFKASIKAHQVIALLKDAGLSGEEALEEYGY